MQNTAHYLPTNAYNETKKNLVSHLSKTPDVSFQTCILEYVVFLVSRGT